MSRLVAAALACSLAALACDSPSPAPGAGRASPTPTPLYTISTAPPEQERLPTEVGLQVRNEALGPSRRRVVQAIRDLKAIGVWRRLTRRLYALQLQTDPGAIPEDAHLADARTDAVIDEKGAGTQCSIRFYPAAFRREMATLDEGYERGLLGAPPTFRHLWAAVLAHELAHCLDWEAGEEFAAAWEQRVRGRLRAAGLE